ncbi:MAG: hypothetical protein ACFE9L_06215 [Candidatus Hodarchaeota archaeon]
MSENKPVKSKTILGLIIWGIRIVMFITFLVFSFVPFISAILLILPRYSDYLAFFVLIIGFFCILGFITIFGIFTLKIELRELGIGLFSFGILFSFSDPYLLALGIILSWSFYEFWYLASHYQQLSIEYSNYASYSTEKQKLLEIFRTQIISFGLLAWIALSISWGILFIASNYYIELGENFGTLGISISAAMIILVYVIQKLYKPIPRS